MRFILVLSAVLSAHAPATAQQLWNCPDPETARLSFESGEIQDWPNYSESHGARVQRQHPDTAFIGAQAKYLEANGGDLGGNGSSMFFKGARWVRYSQTKLANAAFTAALHHRLRDKESKVKALVAHPGWANTELQVTTNKAGGMGSWGSVIAKFVSQSEEDGTLGILSCAVLPEAKCGEFYGPGLGMMASKGEAKADAMEPKYDNPETRNMLWEKSCEAIGSEFIID